MDCFFFEVSYESMTELREEKVHHEVEIEENTLSSCYENSKEDAWVPHGQEYEQMHPLILSLLQQMVNPPMICFQSSQRLQMS